MRYLSTLLLTTTILTNTVTYGAALEDTLTNTTASNFSIHLQDKIDNFKTLIAATSEFNVSDATELLFDPALYPYLSWNSETKDEDVINHVHEILSKTHSFNRNVSILLQILRSISSQDFLEKTESFRPFPSIENSTMLTDIIDGTLCWGHYRNVLTHYNLTFRPDVRLKIYLELLHQTNISPNNLGYILEATTKLAQMFMLEPNAELAKIVLEFKEKADLHFPLKHPYLGNRYSRNTTPEKALTSFENYLDTTFVATNTTIDRILTSFGPDILELMKKIFQHIATHPSIKTDDKLKAANLLMLAGGTSDLFIKAHYDLANDTSRSAKDRLQSIRKLLKLNAITESILSAKAIAADTKIEIQSRLDSADELSNIDSAKNNAINAYRQIIETLKNMPTEENNNKNHYLFEIGLKLHKAGSVVEGINILYPLFLDLFNKAQNDDQGVIFSPSNTIAAIEIFYNRGIFGNKDSAINFISWVVYHGLTSAGDQEAMILGAELAERMGDLTASSNYLHYTESYRNEAGEKFKDRIAALKAKIAKDNHSVVAE